jgi:membrane-bound lytic murein transglycosylase MltF
MRIIAALLMAAAFEVHASQKVESVDHWDDDYDHHFQKHAKHFFGPFFDWRWFKAQAIVESNLNPNARSTAGAEGVMQIKPSTYQEAKRSNPHWGRLRDVSWNIAAAIYYDHYLYRRTAWSSLDSDQRLLFALGAYNAGPTGIMRAMKSTRGTVKAWSDVSPQAPAQTRAYVARIARLVNARHRGPKLRGVAAKFEARRQMAAQKKTHAD